MTLSIGTRVSHTDGRTGSITDIKEPICQKAFDGQTYCTPPRYLVDYGDGESAKWTDKKFLTQTTGGAPEPVPISCDSSSVKLTPVPSGNVNCTGPSKTENSDSKGKLSLDALLKDDLSEFANETFDIHNSAHLSSGGQRRVETGRICEDDVTVGTVTCTGRVAPNVVQLMDVQNAESDNASYNEYNQTPPLQSPNEREELEPSVAELQTHHNVTQTLSQVVMDTNSSLVKVGEVASDNKSILSNVIELLSHINTDTRVLAAQAKTQKFAQDQQKATPRALLPSSKVILAAAAGALVLILCVYLYAQPYFTPGLWLHNIGIAIASGSHDICQAIGDTFLAMWSTMATSLYIAMQSVSAWLSSVNSGVQKYLSEACVGLASTLRSWADELELAVPTPIDVDVHPKALPTVFEHVVGTVINVLGYCVWG